MIDTSEI